MGGTKPGEVSVVQRGLYVSNTIFYQVVAIISVLFMWTFFENASDMKSLFLWHVSLSTAAYLPLMAIGVIVFSEDNLWTIHMPRTKRYTIHGVLFAISVAALSAGIFVETASKNKNANATHFKSIHAILGLTSWVLAVVSLFTGIVAANTGVLPRWVKAVFIKFVHNFLGSAAYVIGIASLWKEINSGSFGRRLSDDALSATYWLVAIITIWSLLAALKSMVNQLRSLFS